MKKTMKMYGLLLSVLLLLVGCENGSDVSLYPFTIDGHEIVVGETTVQTLLDAGLKITMPTTDTDGQITQVEVDADSELEKNSYYSDGMVWITDNMSAKFSMVTEEKDIPMSKAVIAFLSVDLSSGKASDMERITFNGVPVSEISCEKAAELLPDFEGDDTIRYDYGKGGQCQIRFNTEGTRLDGFSVQKTYNVDWDSEY